MTTTDTDALVAELRNAILDIDAHATPFGTDDDGFVSGGYLISVGSLHRALGVVGHSAAKCGGCRNCWTLDQWKAEEQLLRDELEAQAARITELEQCAVTVVRRSRRYRRDERHEFDPGPCPDCGATGRFTVTWIAASISGEDPAEYAVPGTVTCTAATHDHPNQESL